MQRWGGVYTPLLDSPCLSIFFSVCNGGSGQASRMFRAAAWKAWCPTFLLGALGKSLDLPGPQFPPL